MLNADGDFAMHLNLGRYILAEGSIPLKDVFSHTLTGQPVMQHEWLACLIYAIVERILGLGGPVLISAILIATSLTMLFKRLQRENKFLLSAVFVILLVSLNSIVHWLVRPHLTTYLLLALWMMVLNDLFQGKHQRWWFLPAIMLLWVNLHGGFIAGFLTWFIYGFGVISEIFFNRKSTLSGLPKGFWRNYLLGGLTAFIASLLNPSGFGLWTGILSHLGSKYLADITYEFQSPNFHETNSWPFMILIGLLVIVLGMTNKRKKFGLLFCAAAWLLMGLYSARHIPLFGIVAAPLLAGGVDEILKNIASRNKFLIWLDAINTRVQKIDSQLNGVFWVVLSLVIAVGGLGLGLRFDAEGQGYAFDPEVFPVEAVNWIKENPQEGEMFNEFLWGGYLQYRLWPEQRVFIDSKADFYGEDFIRQYLRVIHLEEDWETVLDQYQVDWAIIPLDSPAAGALQFELGWRVLYEDNTAIILQR
jgi:Ca2+/Na+ antiporter